MGVWLITSQRCDDKYGSSMQTWPSCLFGLFGEETQVMVRVVFVYVKPSKFCFK